MPAHSVRFCTLLCNIAYFLSLRDFANRGSLFQTPLRDFLQLSCGNLFHAPSLRDFSQLSCGNLFHAPSLRDLPKANRGNPKKYLDSAILCEILRLASFSQNLFSQNLTHSQNLIYISQILRIWILWQNVAFWRCIMLDFSASYKCDKRDSSLDSALCASSSRENDKNMADSTKCAIIAGNAPSLANIDYSRLPLDFEVFRCNQFYFENKYYLGKKVRAVCFANQALFEQIYTMLLLNNRGEYSVDSAFLNNFYAFGLEGAEFSQNMEIFTSAFRQNIFINRIFDGAHSHKIAEFLEFAVLNQLYNFAHPTSGIWLCAIAVALGFREIYIAGIDFYRGEKVYAFDTLARNFCSFDTNMKDYIAAREQHNAPHTEGYHSKAFDLQCLEFLAKHYGAKFYSLCPQSPISQNLPLAPKTNNSFIPQDKPKDFINDVQIPPKEAYLQFFSPHFKERVKHLKSPARIKTNIYFMALRDAMRLFGDLKLFLKHRRERDKDESI